ncbi:hypothetical protein A2755_02660 [Candidatus Wolfebacteria bacterium RIFCSPHIGHO2_01_FULL_48_22]|uniref:Uncharacterized protein n=2 Tax=Candidatus Wolfeibacteriota TaxID=1752735 RepID=A0A1F8DRP4_9BACT|nr:MAG: hypothetical protein A2755_02660 [Candidatus Wolfebacteria bacterium RIFCSPHIGHO2_01_FULL_48_22]OGM92227.1 MAG: hypothetical protein A2935_00405 [Candidatus Wolfebacteria bacterium RIFCSPLOWO2_01_FULL_47_17b]
MENGQKPFNESNEKTAKRQKTLDRLTKKFISSVVDCLPSQVDAMTMQEWVKNPRALQKVLREALCPPDVRNDFLIF